MCIRDSLKPDDPIIDPVYEKVNELGGITLISLSFCYGPDLSYSDPITCLLYTSRCV